MSDTERSGVFSDEDLERLKEFVNHDCKTCEEVPPPFPFEGSPIEKTQALLHRLECAEAERDALRREREQTRVRLEAAENVLEIVSHLKGSPTLSHHSYCDDYSGRLSISEEEGPVCRCRVSIVPRLIKDWRKAAGK